MPSWNSRVNQRFTALTGYEIRRAAPADTRTAKAEALVAASAAALTADNDEADAPDDQMVVASATVDELAALVADANDPATTERLAAIIGPSLSPLIIYGPEYSGIEQLIQALDRHSEIFAPSDLPMNAVQVRLMNNAERLLAGRGIRHRDAENMLWDHLIRDQLARSRKRLAVVSDAGKGFAWVWMRTQEVWPAATHLHVVRDPADVVAEMVLDRAHNEREQVIERAGRMCNQAMLARQFLPGPTIRYEQLRDQPEQALATVFELLNVEPEPAVIDGFTMPAYDAAPMADGELPEPAREARSNWGYA